VLLRTDRAFRIDQNLGGRSRLRVTVEWTRQFPDEPDLFRQPAYEAAAATEFGAARAWIHCQDTDPARSA
jgi:hypothetical protein